jgi:hypothetical protein
MSECEPTIIDVLTGRLRHEPGLRITAGQRLYYNYRCGGPVSFQTEVETAAAPLGARQPRDFRSRKEREQEPAPVSAVQRLALTRGPHVRG